MRQKVSLCLIKFSWAWGKNYLRIIKLYLLATSKFETPSPNPKIFRRLLWMAPNATCYAFFLITCVHNWSWITKFMVNTVLTGSFGISLPFWLYTALHCLLICTLRSDFEGGRKVFLQTQIFFWISNQRRKKSKFVITTFLKPEKKVGL